MFRTTAHDDRGDPARVHHVWLGRAPLNSPWEFFVRAASVSSSMLIRGPFGRVIAVLAVVAGLIKLVLWLGPFALAIAMFSVVNTTLIMATVAIGLSIVAAWKRQGTWTRDRMLADGVCPSCTYALQDLEPGPDGCVVCPECAAAWERDREPGAVRQVLVTLSQPTPEPRADYRGE